jgi:hypothetical protein
MQKLHVCSETVDVIPAISKRWEVQSGGAIGYAALTPILFRHLQCLVDVR